MNRGGAETLIMNLYRNINKSKVQFDFLTCKPGVFDDEISKMGGKVHRIPYISDVGHFKYIRELDRFFSINNNYKIVHSHIDKMSGLVLRSAKKAGITIRISHSHNTQSEGGIAARTYKWFTGKLIIPNSTNFFACSNYAAKWLFNEKSSSAKILKNGIEPDTFNFSNKVRKQFKEELKLADNTFVLGHVGRFAEQKNHTFLIDVFADLCKENNNSILLLIGDGPLRKDIEEKVRNLNLEKRVMFLGIRSDINRILQGLDIFVFPSLHEGLPVSLIEAQGAGLPCLISDRISPEVDIGRNLVDYASIEDKAKWVNKIRNIASTPFLRTSVNDSLVAQGYDISATANHIEDFYLKISG
nr:glycosyltransferase family 1 protein [Lederbergia citrea]